MPVLPAVFGLDRARELLRAFGVGDDNDATSANAPAAQDATPEEA